MLNRRNFIKSLFFVGSVTLVIGIDKLLSRTGKIDLSDKTEALLCNFYHNKRSAIVVGKKYLNLQPQEANKSFLASNIILSLNIKDSEFSMPIDLRTLVRNKVIKDFNEDKIVYVCGWMLSRTEARLSALAALCK